MTCPIHFIPAAPSCRAKGQMLIPAPSDPLTCPVVKGHKTLIVVDRGYDKGLGISLVGGADTQQVHAKNYHS